MKQPCKFVHVLILVPMENLYQLLVVLVNLLVQYQKLPTLLH